MKRHLGQLIGFLVVVAILAGWRKANDRYFKTYVETSRDIANRRR